MAVYDLEEQEQLEDLKAWWRRWGNLVTAAIVAVCIVVVGIQGWRWWKQRQAEEAGTLYTAAVNGVRAKELPKVRDAVSQLTDKFAGTPYAASGAFLLARMLYDSGDKAGAATQLQWVIDRGEPEMQQIARYRLAEIKLDAKAYDEALRLLDTKHDEAFEGVYADLRGDVLAAAGRNEEARKAYEIAVNKLDAKSPYRSYVQVKLDALGGPMVDAAATGNAATTGSAAPATTPPAAATTPPAATASAAPAPAPPVAPASAPTK